MQILPLMMTIKKTIVFTTMIVISHFATAVSPPSSNEDVSALAAQLGILTTLKGKFQQILIDDKENLLQQSSGEFVLKRPGFFRWQTLEPFPQLLVSNLENIWLYDADLEQVTIRKYDNSVASTPALLLSGDVEQINQHYQVNKIAEQTYELLPLEGQALFTRLLVMFEAQQLRKMELFDSLGQKTTFILNETIINSTIEDSLFNFSPPSGTDVIRDH